jgi:hypothetical protein
VNFNPVRRMVAAGNTRGGTRMTRPISHAALVERIAGGLVDAGKLTPDDPLAPMALACDVASKVIVSYPREQWQAVTQIFLTRLGNVLDRRAHEGTQ